MQFSLADRDAIWASKLSWVPLCAHVPNAPFLQANSRDVSRETSVRFPFLSAGWCLRAGGSRSAGDVHRHGTRSARQALRARGTRQARRAQDAERGAPPPRLHATGKRAQVAHSASPVWQNQMFHVKHLCGFTCSLQLTRFLRRAHDYSL